MKRAEMHKQPRLSSRPTLRLGRVGASALVYVDDRRRRKGGSGRRERRETAADQSRSEFRRDAVTHVGHQLLATSGYGPVVAGYHGPGDRSETVDGGQLTHASVTAYFKSGHATHWKA